MLQWYKDVIMGFFKKIINIHKNYDFDFFVFSLFSC